MMAYLNCSEDEEKNILETLNAGAASLHVGGIIFLCVLLSLGIIGNIHVLVVFERKIKLSNHKIFITCLSCVDLIACLVGMPFLLVDLTHPLTFQGDILCKLARGTNYFLCNYSSFLMTVITVDRYRKVCHPLEWQISNKVAKLLCALCSCAALLVTWPALLIFGQSSISIDSKFGTCRGSKCDVDDAYKNGSYLTIYNGFIVSLALTAFLIHTILYTLIAKTLCTRNTENYKIQAVEQLDTSKYRKVRQIQLRNLVKIPMDQRNKTVNEKSDVHDEEVMRTNEDETRNQASEGHTKSDDDVIHNEIMITVKSQLSITIRNNTNFSVRERPKMRCELNERRNTETNIKQYVDLSEVGDKQSVDFSEAGDKQFVDCSEVGDKQPVDFSEVGDKQSVDLSEVRDNRWYENDHPERDENSQGTFVKTSVDKTDMVDSAKQDNLRSTLSTKNERIITPNNTKRSSESLQRTGAMDQSQLLRQKRKITIIFFVMVAIFFFSYIPHLGMKLYKHARPEAFKTLSRSGRIVYNTIIWVLFVHYTANPFVLIFLDRKFRVEVMSFYKKMFCCK